MTEYPAHTLHLDVRRWFQATYGNTYHTVAVYVDSGHIGTSERTYGYGDHYLHTAGTILRDAGLLEDVCGSTDPYDLHTRPVRERGRYIMTETVRDGLKRELHR